MNTGCPGLELSQGAIRRELTVAFTASLFLTAFNPQQTSAQLCIQLSAAVNSQDFNSLAASGTTNNISTTIPSGFTAVEAGGGANVTYAANDGSGTTANTYSYGTGTNTDRALGEITDASVQSTVGACFVNNTGHSLAGFQVGYTGEEWRLGVADATVDQLDFQFSTNATALNNGTWIDVNALDFATPNNTSPAGEKNGNSAANRTVFSPIAITTSALIPPNSVVFMRWLPTNLTGDDDGLAIDDFSLEPLAGTRIFGDYNDNEVIDAADYVIWRNQLGPGSIINEGGISPGTVDMADYDFWKSRFGKTIGSASGSAASVPEPPSGILAVVIAFALLLRRRAIHAIP